MTATRPLEHVRVLDLSRMFPGAYCTSLLADLGADVLKVEAPRGGDGLRFMSPDPFPASHVALNRGKRSLTLDLRTQQGPDVLRRLAAEADVLVESHRPGALDALGIGFEALRAANEGLVWCSLTGFGPDGPLAEAPGHDLTYLGFSGLLGTLAVDDRPPVPGSTISLALAGVMGAFGIVSALAGRDRTGAGCRVDATMVDAAMWVIADQVAQAANARVQSWGSLASRNNYRCADGRWITCTASEPRTWAVLIEAVGAPELADYRIGVDDEAAGQRLGEIFASAPAAQWVASPGPAGGIGPVAEPADLLQDPQVLHRKSVVALERGQVLANPLRLDGVDGDAATQARSPAPALGEHTDAALAAAGFSGEEIASLREAGVL